MAVTRIGQSTIKQGLKKNETFTAGIPPILGKMYPIETITVGAGGAASIAFTSIPGTYQHLQVRGFTPFDVRDGTIRLRFNSDTSSNYRRHWLYGNGSSALATTSASAQSDIRFAYDTNAAPNSSVAKSFVMDILDYASTSKNTTIRSLSGTDVNGGGSVELASGVWIDTSAVTSLTFAQYGNLGGYGSQNFAQHSTFTLYGIKA